MAWTVDTSQNGYMLSYCLHQPLTQPPECRSRSRDSSDQAMFFFSFLLSNFGQVVWIVASVSFCSSPSTLRLDILYVQRYCSEQEHASRSAVSEIFKPASLVPTPVLHSKLLTVSHLSSPFWYSVWTSAGCLEYAYSSCHVISWL